MVTKLFTGLVLIVGCLLAQNVILVKAYGLKEVKDHRIIYKHKAPPVYGKINEVELANGEQKYLYFIIKDAKKLLRVGLKGYIYKDKEYKNIIGKFLVTSVNNNFVIGKIIELYNSIGDSAYVGIEVDSCCLIQ